MMDDDTEQRLTFTGWVSSLARRHTADLAGIARAEGLTADDALDAIQEAFHTFLSLPQARSLVGAPDDSRALMSVIVRNAARNMRRRHHRSKPHEDIDQTPDVADSMPTVDALVEVAEAHVQLVGCMNRLGEIQRNVARMRMLEQVGNAEVAQRLELRPGHVAVLLHRAKESVVRCMAADPTR